MCLLMHKPAASVITRELADDIYKRNEDGFGIMYAEDNMLYTQKTLGNADAIWEIIQANQHREMLLHWRMRTHGNIDLTNCHPYEVYGDGSTMPVYMMHNGVLSTGNSKDATKSDTWHYIRDWIHPLTANDPSILFTHQMRTFISGHIGSSNKFAMMNHLGEVSICNRTSGIEHAGLWFSNTYAWDASKFGAVRPAYSGGYGYSRGYDDDWRYDRYMDTKATKPVTKSTPIAQTKTKQLTLPETGKRGRGRPRKHPVVTTTPTTEPTAPKHVPDLRSILVSDVRTLLKAGGLDTADKGVSNAALGKLVALLGYSDVADLVQMCEYGEMTEHQLLDCMNDPSMAWLFMYGTPMQLTADQQRSAAHDNARQAEVLGFSEWMDNL